MDVEQITEIRAGMDASGVKKGAGEVVDAFEGIAAVGGKVVQVNDQVTGSQTKVSRSLTDTGAGMERLRRQYIDGYAEVAKYNDLQDRLKRNLELGRTTQDEINKILAVAADRMGLVAQKSGEMATRLNAAAQANQAFATAAANGYADMGEKITFAAGSVDNLKNRMESLRAGLTDGIGNVGQYAGAWDRVSESLDAYIEQARKASAVTTEQIVQAKMAQDALNSQANANTLTGVRTSPGSVGGSAVSPFKSAADSGAVFQAQFDAEEKLAAENARLTSTYAPLTTATLAHQKVLDDLTLAVDRGIVTEKEAQTIREKSATNLANYGNNLQKVGDTTWQTRFATQQLGVQSIQFFSSIQAGQPILTAFIQQGHQIVDVALSTGTGFGVLGSAIKAVGAFLAGPGGLVVAGAAAAAAIVAVSVAAENSNLRMARLQLSMQGLRDDFGAMAANADVAAKALAKTTTLSTDAAREITGALGKVMDFHGNANDFVAFGKDILALSNIMGETIPQATKRFTDAMELPSKAAADLIGKVKGIDEALVDSLKGMEARGKYDEAFATLLQKERDAAQGALKPLSDLDAAHRRLSEAFTAAGQNNKSFMETMGAPFVRALSAIENGIAGVVEKLRQWNDQVSKAGGPSLGEFMLRGISPLLPGGLVTSYATSGAGGTGGRPAATNDGMVTISAPGGAQFTVRQDLAPAFQGLVNELENSGYLINPSDVSSYRPGATVAGTGQPSMHAGGTAIDINASLNGVGTSGNIPPALAATLAQKYGLTWGGNFRNPDPMHFGTDITGTQPAIDASRRIIGAGQTAYDSSGVVSRQLEENQRKQETLLASIDALQKKYNEKAAQIEDPQGAEAQMDILTKQMDQQKELLASLKGARTDIMSTQDAAAKAAENANKALVGEVGAQRDLNAAQQRMKELGEAAGTGVDQAALFRVQGAELAKLTIQANDNVAAIDLQTQAQMRLTPILEKGGIAAEFAANAEKAIEDARKTSLPGTAERTRQEQAETLALNTLTLAKRDNQAATSLEKSNEQLDMLRLENELITATTEQRNREIAVLQKRQELGLKIGDEATTEQQKALDAARAVADMTTQLQVNQQAIQEIGNLGTQVFDQVGNAITQAFVGGQGAAVNFGNVARAVLTSVLQEVLKLAVLNPILNATVGGANRTTLDQIVNAVGSSGGGSSGASGGSSLMSLASTGGSAISGGNSILQALGYKGLGEQLGLTGPGGLFGGSGGGITGLLNTSISGGSPITTAGELPGLGASSTVGGATIGGALGGFGAGFTVGSLLGTGEQKLLNKTGPGPEIGAGLGAAIGVGGAVLAPETFGVSLLLAGLLGGAAGGIGGGLIGPHPASAYSGAEFSINPDNGSLVLGKHSAQGTADNAAQVSKDIDTLNDSLAKLSIAVVSTGGLHQVGANTPGGFQDPSKVGSIAEAVPSFRFSSSDATFNKYIADKSFPAIEELINQATEFNNLTQVTIPALTKQVTVTGSLNDAIAQINATYQPAIDLATKYGVATDDLAAMQKKATDIAAKAASDAAGALANQVRYQELSNRATLTGNPLDAQAAALAQFDDGLQAVRDQMTSQLTAIYGDVFKSSDDYAHRMADLETALGDQRLTIVKQYADQMIAAQQAINDSLTGLQGRSLLAQSKLSGTLEDAQTAALYSFDASKPGQETALAAQFKALYGTAYTQQQQYQDALVQLENTLGLERLAVVKGYTDQIAARDQAAADAQAKALADAQAQADAVAAATQKALDDQAAATAKALQDQADAQAKALAAQVQAAQQAAAQQQQLLDQASSTAAQAVSSLTAYADQLRTSNYSPLSPADRYDQASRQFNAVSGAAAAGDYNSLSQVQSYATSFLDSSRDKYGSGVGYADDFQRVLQALDKVSNVDPNTLTASVMQTETRTQTATLVAELERLRTEISGLQSSLVRVASTPARLVA